MNLEKSVGDILTAILGINCLQCGLQLDTPLLGAIPELDSMAVVNILTALEEQLGISIEDTEVTAEIFTTFSSIVEFVENKF